MQMFMKCMQDIAVAVDKFTFRNVAAAQRIGCLVTLDWAFGLWESRHPLRYFQKGSGSHAGPLGELVSATLRISAWVLHIAVPVGKSFAYT